MSKYTTVQGDMWDSISYHQLGDVKHTDLLINANLKYKDIYIFSGGIVLDIPDVNKFTSKADRPPWKVASG